MTGLVRLVQAHGHSVIAAVSTGPATLAALERAAGHARGRPCPAAREVGSCRYRWIVQLKLADPDAPVVSVAVTVTE
jgi:hypothetical protein